MTTPADMHVLPLLHEVGELRHRILLALAYARANNLPIGKLSAVYELLEAEQTALSSLSTTLLLDESRNLGKP